ncbi:SHC-transforming protein 1-like isoform X2 [Takifugu flavidus]|uniref:SHC-transforming protein 1-like isoform X2 n=1 Tax=Takifugu flavidus TaxID=433684 RepID=UPI0025449831|nr:SHC-transforming protein 1-like isoform X2 [Takifugu flavidus]
MLRRTKYSRLRNDSLTSLEDRPQRVLSLKRDLCLDSDFALLDPGTPDHHEGSNPHMGNTGPQSGPRGQTTRDQTTCGHADGTDWDWRSGCRLCKPPSFPEPPSSGPSALSCTKRPISLQRMTSLPSELGCSCSRHGAGPRCLEAAAGDLTTVQTAPGSVHHNLKYLGNVEVTKSMRTLDSETRIQLTREAISRLCERTSVTAAVKMKRPGPKQPSSVLGGTNLQFSGTSVVLSVSADSLSLIAASSLQKIARHPMQTISFASGGDPEMADYIAYVAKDIFSLRACHILECPRGRASEVINSIGQAFESRFRRVLSHRPALFSPNTRPVVRMCHKRRTEDTNTDQKAKLEGEIGQSCDYYNLFLETAPPAGHSEHLQLTKDKNKLSIGIQKVSLYENCPAEGTSALPADSGESQAAAEELIQDQSWFQGRFGRHRAEAVLTCAGDFMVRERSSASSQCMLGGVEEGTAHRH